MTDTEAIDRAISACTWCSVMTGNGSVSSEVASAAFKTLQTARILARQLHRSRSEALWQHWQSLVTMASLRQKLDATRQSLIDSAIPLESSE